MLRLTWTIFTQTASRRFLPLKTVGRGEEEEDGETRERQEGGRALLNIRADRRAAAAARKTDRSGRHSSGQLRSLSHGRARSRSVSPVRFDGCIATVK